MVRGPELPTWANDRMSYSVLKAREEWLIQIIDQEFHPDKMFELKHTPKNNPKKFDLILAFRKKQLKQTQDIIAKVKAYQDHSCQFFQTFNL
jgi:hypothetical protein